MSKKPTYKEMIIGACQCRESNEDCIDGTTRQYIKKYLESNYKIDPKDPRQKSTIAKMIKSGELVINSQHKGHFFLPIVPTKYEEKPIKKNKEPVKKEKTTTLPKGMITSQVFGSFIQEQHPSKIFFISWAENKTETVSLPHFYFFNTLDEVIDHFGTDFETPFQLVTDDDFIDCIIHVSVGQTALLFDDERRTMRFYYYKEDYIGFQCYQDDVYEKLKVELSKEAVPHNGIFENL